MTCLFIADPADASISGQEVAALFGTLELPECVAQCEAAVCPQILAGLVDIGSSVVRESMPSCERLLNVGDEPFISTGRTLSTQPRPLRPPAAAVKMQKVKSSNYRSVETGRPHF